MDFQNKTVTITFGDQAENHKGMQIIGKAAEKGFTYDDLMKSKDYFEKKGVKCEMFHLNSALPENVKCDDAYLLVIRDFFTEEESRELYEEQMGLEYDSKAYMYGRVVNKHARHNLCFAEYSQEPDYEKGMGRIINYKDVPKLESLHNKLGTFIEGGSDLAGEGNYYYDVRKCGIGFHGDSERCKVFALRLGTSLPIHYQWFYEGKPVGKRIIVPLHHGNMYIMSQKTVGQDWKKKKSYTLRHATGCDKFTTIS